MKYQEWRTAACDPAARRSMERAGVPPLAALRPISRGAVTPEHDPSFSGARWGQLLE